MENSRMENSRLNLSAPWYTYQKKLKALFAYDDDVTVGPVTDAEGGHKALEIQVRGADKAAALERLLYRSVSFGNVTLSVNVIEDDVSERTPADLWKAAFAHNPLLWSVQTRKDDAGVEHTYAVFEPEVLQFFNDDLSDYRGNFTALTADVARDVFKDTGVCVCTADLTENTD